MRARVTVTLVCAIAIIGTACSTSDSTLRPASPTNGAPPVARTKQFGVESAPCLATVLTNADDDQQRLAEGVGCFLDAVADGLAVVWDVQIATPEGAPVLYRYLFDAEVLIITSDYSFDPFSSGGVFAERCTEVVATAWLPRGANCTEAVADGFDEDSLPGR
jgi:hypothetical protein